MNSFLRRGWNWFAVSLVLVGLVAISRICFGREATPTELGAMAAGTQGSLGGNPGLSDINSVGVGALVSGGLLNGVIGALLGKYGWAVALLSWMSSLRLIFKTVTTQIEKIVKESPSSRDDQILAEVEASKGWKLFCWLIDLLASIKIGTQFTARASGPSDPRNDGFVPAAATPSSLSNDHRTSNIDHLGLVMPMAVGLGICFLSGCSVLDKAGGLVSRPVVSAVTNIVVEVRTNFVPVAVAVPGETRFVTNLVEHVTTNTIEHVTEHTNFVEKAGIETGMAVAKAGASLAPPPYNAIAAGVLAVVSGGLGFLVKRKNDQVKAANASNDVLRGSIDDLAGENDSQAKQLQAVVSGVEQITTAIDKPTGDKVKGIIADASKALGVSDDLHATVQGMKTGVNLGYYEKVAEAVAVQPKG